jgi:hypothetical protein
MALGKSACFLSPSALVSEHLAATRFLSSILDLASGAIGPVGETDTVSMISPMASPWVEQERPSQQRFRAAGYSTSQRPEVSL